MQQLTADEIPELLARLVDKSLVSVDSNGRYDLLQLVRSFAQEELMRTGDESARVRHLRFFHGISIGAGKGMFGPGQASAISLFRQEIDNIRVAAEWATSSPETWKFAPTMVEELFYYMHSQGTYEGGDSLASSVIQTAPSDLEFELAMAMTWLCVFQQFRFGDIASKTADQAIEIGEKVNNVRAVAGAYFQKANIAWRKKQYDEGDAFATRALEFANESCEKRLQGAILTTFGNYSLMRGQLDRALDFYRKCEQVYDDLGHVRGLAVVQGNLAHVHERLGEYEDEYRLSRNVLVTFYELGDKRNLAGTIAGCASGFWLSQDFESAAMLLGGAEALWQEVETYPDDLDGDTAVRWRERLVDRIGEEAFGAAFDRGKSMPLKEIVQLIGDNAEPWKAVNR